MLTSILLFSCLATLASAQLTYPCIPTSACANSGFTREVEMGCQYWCYLDSQETSVVGSLDCPDFHLAFMKWKGNAAECDRAAYIAAHEEITPRACLTELNKSFDNLATNDSPTSTTISGTDIQIWCDEVKDFSGATGTISQPNWQVWYHEYFGQTNDPTCDK